jgi:hypothetical protein
LFCKLGKIFAVDNQLNTINMRLPATTLILSLFLIIISCDNSPEEVNPDEPSYYLKGLIDNLNELNLAYTEKADGRRKAGTNHNPVFESTDYYIEQIAMVFAMDPGSSNRIEITYSFKYDKDEYPWYNLSNFDGIEELKEMMLEGNWGFDENYMKTDKFVDISYRSAQYFGKGQIFYAYDPTDSTKNAVSNFAIESIEEYEDWQSGDGLRIRGSFDAVLYNKDDSTDSISMDNMEFQGFMTLQYCGQYVCQ